MATGQPGTRALQPRPQQAPGRQPTLHLTPVWPQPVPQGRAPAQTGVLAPQTGRSLEAMDEVSRGVAVGLRGPHCLGSREIRRCRCAHGSARHLPGGVCHWPPSIILVLTAVPATSRTGGARMEGTHEPSSPPPSLRVGWGQDPGFQPFQHHLAAPVPQVLPGDPPSAESKEARTTGQRKHHSRLMCGTEETTGIRRALFSSLTIHWTRLPVQKLSLKTRRQLPLPGPAFHSLPSPLFYKM